MNLIHWVLATAGLAAIVFGVGLGLRYSEPVVRIYTDPGTGCQYLMSRQGQFAPRLDLNLRQLGCGK